MRQALGHLEGFPPQARPKIIKLSKLQFTSILHVRNTIGFHFFHKCIIPSIKTLDALLTVYGFRRASSITWWRPSAILFPRPITSITQLKYMDCIVSRANSQKGTNEIKVHRVYFRFPCSSSELIELLCIWYTPYANHSSFFRRCSKEGASGIYRKKRDGCFVCLNDICDCQWTGGEEKNVSGLIRRTIWGCICCIFDWGITSSRWSTVGGRRWCKRRTWGRNEGRIGEVRIVGRWRQSTYCFKNLNGHEHENDWLTLGVRRHPNNVQ